jgi:DNA/RNA endonuclease G (NUC1)
MSPYLAPGMRKLPSPLELQMLADTRNTFNYIKGHLSPSADRSRNEKDARATFLTSNILPQHPKHNTPLWSGLEAFTRELVKSRGREVYAYAGGVGEKNANSDKASISISNDSTYGSYAVQIPLSLMESFAYLRSPRTRN